MEEENHKGWQQTNIGKYAPISFFVNNISTGQQKYDSPQWGFSETADHQDVVQLSPSSCYQISMFTVFLITSTLLVMIPQIP